MNINPHDEYHIYILNTHSVQKNACGVKEMIERTETDPGEILSSPLLPALLLGLIGNSLRIIMSVPVWAYTTGREMLFKYS